MSAVQVAQNKMLRVIEGVSLKQHIPSKVLREKFGLPVVNQLAAEIKLTEAWKSINLPNYPFQVNLLPSSLEKVQSSNISVLPLWGKSVFTKYIFSTCMNVCYSPVTCK